MKIWRHALALTLLGATPLLGSTGCSSAAPDAELNPSVEPLRNITTQFRLRTDMRRLWTDHATWTRVFIMSTIADLPDAPDATRRLLQTQVDLGNAIKPFYGDEAGNELTILLYDHVSGAIELVAAAKANDQVRLDQARIAWHKNGKEIAAFLARTNTHLDLKELEEMMRIYLDQTLAQVGARLAGEWKTDVVKYNESVNSVLMMSDTLSAGIVEQFPELIAPDKGMTRANQQLHLTMRKLWEEHVTWTRVYIISDFAGLPDAEVARARLLRNQTDIGRAIMPFYGVEAGKTLTKLLQEHVTLEAEVLSDVKTGASSELSGSMAAWYASGDAIADFLAGTHTAWSREELRSMIRAHFDQTLVEARARLKGQWRGDIEAYDAVVKHILHLSDALSDGIAEQFPDRLSDEYRSGLTARFQGTLRSIP